MFDDKKYSNIDESLEDVKFEKGWKKMREVRETHNDITFIDTYLSSEFIDNENYFAYDFNPESNRNEVSQTDLDSVKKKLLLDITNNGKPTIVATDNNYKNEGQLLLSHKYNGVPLDISQAEKVLMRLFRLWGRPVNLKTIDKDKEGDEQGKIITYDGQDTSIEKTGDVDDIRADEIDYDTKPDSWS
jgi:stage V sporulation protein R